MHKYHPTTPNKSLHPTWKTVIWFLWLTEREIVVRKPELRQSYIHAEYVAVIWSPLLFSLTHTAVLSALPWQPSARCWWVSQIFYLFIYLYITVSYYHTRTHTHTHGCASMHALPPRFLTYIILQNTAVWNEKLPIQSRPLQMHLCVCVCFCHSSHLSDSNVISKKCEGCCVIHICVIDCGGKGSEQQEHTCSANTQHTHTQQKQQQKKAH